MTEHLNKLNQNENKNEIKNSLDSNNFDDKISLDLTNKKNLVDYIKEKCPIFFYNIEILDYINTSSAGTVYKFKFRDNLYKGKVYSNKFLIKIKRSKSHCNATIIEEKLHHDNISKIFVFYKIKDFYLLSISEYAKYGDLSNFTKKFLKGSILSETFINYISKPILEGINYMKKNKIIHMDIKEQKIILDHLLNPKIIGFSRAFSYEKYKPNDLIKLLNIGTGRYMAPEKVNELEIEAKYGDKIDIYSLGVTLYNLAFGSFPYGLNNVKDDDYNKLKEKLNNEKLEFPNENKISNLFKNFLINVLEKDYKKRYNIKEALEDPWIKGWDIIDEEREIVGIEENFQNFFVKLDNNIPKFNKYIKNSNSC